MSASRYIRVDGEAVPLGGGGEELPTWGPVTVELGEPDSLDGDGTFSITYTREGDIVTAVFSGEVTTVVDGQYIEAGWFSEALPPAFAGLPGSSARQIHYGDGTYYEEVLLYGESFSPDNPYPGGVQLSLGDQASGAYVPATPFNVTVALKYVGAPTDVPPNE